MSGKMEQLRQTCRQVRKLIINTITDVGSGHTGGSLSVVEILAALYFRIMKINPDRPDWPERDRFILSKGHASAGLYCVLAERGYFSKNILPQFDGIDSCYWQSPMYIEPTLFYVK